MKTKLRSEKKGSKSSQPAQSQTQGRALEEITRPPVPEGTVYSLVFCDYEKDRTFQRVDISLSQANAIEKALAYRYGSDSAYRKLFEQDPGQAFGNAFAQFVHTAILRLVNQTLTDAAGAGADSEDCPMTALENAKAATVGVLELFCSRFHAAMSPGYELTQGEVSNLSFVQQTTADRLDRACHRAFDYAHGQIDLGTLKPRSS